MTDDTAPATRTSRQVDVSLGDAPPFWRLQDVAVLAVLASFLYVVGVPAVSEANFGIYVGGGQVVIRDMASHLTFAREFWHGAADYSAASHARITEKWAEENIGRALPFGYSPTMLWLLWPLSRFPLLAGFACWTLLSAAGLWWMARQRVASPWISTLFLLSPLSLLCLALGQTALLSSAGVVYLMRKHPRPNQRGLSSRPSHEEVGSILVLWALTAKPPVALAAGFALLALSRYRIVVAAIALTAASTFAIGPRLGAHWIQDYLQLTAHYDRESASPLFAWSLRPDLMSNLRSVVWYSGVAGDHLAYRLSTVAWLASSLLLTVTSARLHLRSEMCFALAVMSYLLFFPHVSSTEDISLIVPLFAVLSIATVADRGGDETSRGSTLARLPYSSRVSTLAVVALALLPQFLPPEILLPASGARTASIFATKLVIASFLAYGISGHSSSIRAAR